MSRPLLFALLASLLITTTGCPDTAPAPGDNTLPTVTISNPDSATSYSADATVPFEAEVGDSEDAPESLDVSLESSLQGPIVLTSVSDEGAIYEDLELAEGSHTLTLSVTDSSGGSASASIDVTVVAGNRLPTVSISSPDSVSIYFSDTAVPFEAQVADLEDAPASLVVSLESSVQGTIVTTVSEAGVLSDALNLVQGDHTLTLSVTDTDGGTASASVDVTVDNSPPSIAAVSITPDPAYVDSTLTAVPSGWQDADGDLESAGTYTFAWSVGGNPVGGDEPTLSSGNFLRGDLVSVAVTPADTSSTGLPVSSADLEISNSPPTAPVVVITPDILEEDYDLYCNVTSSSSDLDGDAVTYSFAWLVDGAPSGETGEMVDNSVTLEGETWTCEATPNDGLEDGAVGSVSAGPLLPAFDGWPIDPTPFPLNFGADYGWTGLSFDGSGNILALRGFGDSALDDLVTVEAGTGNISVLSVTGSYPGGAGGCPGIAYRRSNATIYVICAGTGFYAVDPSNGQETLLATPPETLFNIAVAPEGFGNFQDQIIGIGQNGTVTAYEVGTDLWTPILTGSGTYSGLAFDSNGALYIVDGTSLYEVSPSGVLTTITSGFPAGSEGIAIDGGTAFVTAGHSAGVIIEVDLGSGVSSTFSSGYTFDTGWNPNGMLMGNNGNLAFVTGEYDPLMAIPFVEATVMRTISVW